MPFYEYECQSCKYYLEVMQKISDAPLTKCPSCGKKTLIKLISAPVFRLKGSGWYETDFKTEKERQRNLAGAEREESKPAESTETAKPAEAPAKAPEAPAKAPEAPAKAPEAAAKAPAKAPESKPQPKTPSVVRAPVKRRAAPAVRKSAGSGARAAPRPRGKSTPAKGAARGRSKR